jgi:hypothetical protein
MIFLRIVALLLASSKKISTRLATEWRFRMIKIEQRGNFWRVTGCTYVCNLTAISPWLLGRI